MSSITPTTGIKCAWCQGPAARVCSGCKDVRGFVGCRILDPIRYCSSQCQKADWPRHKRVCKYLQSRKALYRAGELLQDMFYIFKEKMFNRVVVAAEEKDGKLYITEGDLPDVKEDHDILVPFPSKLFPKLEDKQAILTYMACPVAVACMHEITKYLLKDIAADIREIAFMAANHKRPMVLIDEEEDDLDTYPPHDILKVYLKDGGEIFALDLTGAQYGYHDPITPWSIYLERRCETYVYRGEFQYFGGTRDRHTEAGKKDDYHGKMARMETQACKAFMCVALSWEEETGLTVEELLKLPEETFKKRKHEIVELVGWMIQSFLDIELQLTNHFASYSLG